MEQILIIEDDTDINNMMASALTKAGYECKQAFSGTEAMLYLNNEKFSVIILDLMLPGKSGNSIVEEIKPHLDTPIIVVSAKDKLDTKVNLLFSGADDYMTKPFEIDELIARVAVQIRKHSTDKSETVYHYKDMVLNITEHSISVSGHPISFTRQEFKILELLITNPKCRTTNWGRRKRRNNFPHRGKGTAQSGRRKRDAGEKAALWCRR